MKCHRCKEELPESEFSNSRLKFKYPICKKCENTKAKEYRNKDILSDADDERFDRYYGGINIYITNYPQEYQIIKTTGEHFQTKDKDKFLKKLIEMMEENGYF